MRRADSSTKIWARTVICLGPALTFGCAPLGKDWPLQRGEHMNYGNAEARTVIAPRELHRWELSSATPSHLRHQNRVESFLQDSTIAFCGLITGHNSPPGFWVLFDCLNGRIERKMPGGMFNVAAWGYFKTISPDGRFVVWNHHDMDSIRIEVYHTQLGQVVRRLAWDHDTFSFHWFPDSQRFIANTTSGLYIFDVNARAQDFGPVGKIATRGYFCMIFSADGKRLVTGSLDVTVWDVATGKPLAKSTPVVDDFWRPGPRRPDIFVSPDGEEGVVGDDGYIHVGYDSLAMPDDGRCIVAGANNGRIFVFDASTGAVLAEHREKDGWRNDITSVSMTADGERVLFSTKKGVVRLWEWRSNRIVASFGQEFDLKDHRVGRGRIVKAVFALQGTHAVVARDDGTVALYELVAASGH
jgi:WD40 repeat protein